ncbi:hypothetical protein AB0I77_02125 [Streptomyces sp. NPDC050619]|uniref:hypothetical protein n=1 Tax=Streptomyces sp. NPDC050619 TaxID=3157214 RepID=UPI0034471920
MAEQKAEQKSTQDLPQPLRAAASAISKVPGATMVGRAAEGALDKVGAVSPRGRRIAVYTGAGVLGVAGLVEWPVAVTGAAVAWLTQPRGQEETEENAETAKAIGSTGQSGAARGAGSSRTSSGSKTSGNASKASGNASKASGKTPTPKAVAAATKSPARASRATPSDKLPAHDPEHDTASPATPRGGPGGSTTTRHAPTSS